MDRKREMTKLNSEYEKLPNLTAKWQLSKRFVPGDGPLDAKVMFIGQAPGRKEDLEGKPFIGTSGKFLTRLINLAGLDRKEVYICSVVQYFPPANRIPTDREIGLCKSFLYRQMEIINPKIVILLGAVACKTVLDMKEVSKIRGTVVKKDGRTYFVSMHPAAAVRIRTKMPLMENDFTRLKGVIKKEIL